MKKRYIIPLFIFFVIFAIIWFTMKKYNIEQVKEVYENNNDIIMKEIKEEEGNYKINIYYPKTKYKVLNNEIEENIYKIYEEFKSSAININLENPYIEITYNINEVNIKNNNIISIVFNIKSLIDRTHPNDDFYTINYNITTGKIITIDDLILKNNDILNIFSSVSYETLKDNEKIKQYINETNLKNSFDNNKITYQIFAFDKQGIIIYFNTYSLAPFAAGNFSVSIPYSKLDNII